MNTVHGVHKNICGCKYSSTYSIGFDAAFGVSDIHYLTYILIWGWVVLEIDSDAVVQLSSSCFPLSEFVRVFGSGCNKGSSSSMKIEYWEPSYFWKRAVLECSSSLQIASFNIWMSKNLRSHRRAMTWEIRFLTLPSTAALPWGANTRAEIALYDNGRLVPGKNGIRQDRHVFIAEDPHF